MRPTTLRALAVVAVVGLSAYMLRGLLVAICWALVIAVSTWGLHERLGRHALRGSARWSAALLTASALVLLLLPTAYLVVEGAREVPVLLRLWATSNEQGLPAPAWLPQLPWVGPWVVKQWDARIAAPGALATALHGFAAKVAVVDQRAWLAAAGHRLMNVFFSIVVLFFLYLKGAELAADFQAVVRRHLGAIGLHAVRLAVATMRGTVNGLLLVALALALILAAAYGAAGLPHAVLWGLVTGLLGIVPFGATVALAGVGLYLAATGAVQAALILFVAGGALIFAADHFIRPMFISGTSRLSAVLVLLGIFGGLETFGLLGLFVGPTLMAVLAAVWTELCREPDADAPGIIESEGTAGAEAAVPRHGPAASGP